MKFVAFVAVIRWILPDKAELGREAIFLRSLNWVAKPIGKGITLLIAGRALWTAGDDTRMRGAGDMIHHPSLMPHAFKTESEGFLALWRWSGDINTHSYTFIGDRAIES